MNRFGQGAFFAGRGSVRLAGHSQPPAIHRKLAQATPVESPRVVEARRALDKAVQHYQSVEDNLSMLDETMGPEAALQALEEGSDSIERARKELELLGGIISE